jgi:sigma-B regulation protein RsbU (phosphoserine phosphatase)
LESLATSEPTEGLASNGSEVAHADVDNDILDARILIVEDSAVIRAAIVAQLRGAGFGNLVQAADGVEGLQLAKKSQPELIITDLTMPNMDGFELCRRLNADPRLRQIPILVETGMENSDDRAAAFDAGATDLISKPLNKREFLGRVRVHLERGRLVSRLSEFQRRMNVELYQARATQELILPTSVDIGKIQAEYPVLLASHYEASIGIGGDFWGISPLGPDRCRVFCADFAGHGVGAALNTFRLHSFMSRELDLIEEPDEWLAQINGFLCGVLPVGQYATMFCGVVDFASGVLQYAAASAPAPIVLSAGIDQHFHLIDGCGFPLGITREATYDRHTVPFGPGSQLFIYSDALIETPDLVDSIFSAESLCAFIDARAHDMSPVDIQGAVLAALHAGAPERPSDDLTVVALKHVPGVKR